MRLKIKLLALTASVALAASAFAQPTSGPTGGALNVNPTTGAITGPISAGAFIGANDLQTASEAANDYQPLHENLTAIAGLTGAADRLFYFNGATTVAITTFTAVARQLLDDATFADMRTTLGLGSGDTPTFAALNTTAFDGSTAQIIEGSFKVTNSDGYTRQQAGSFTLYQASPEKTTEFTPNGIFVDGTPVATIGATTFSITGNAATVTTNANLTGHVISSGNATTLGTFNLSQLNTALSDADVATGGGTATGANTGDQTITLTGDVAGTGTGTFAATIQANSVALGTDTTGNYVATIADSGASEITVANSGTENAAVTLAIASSIARDSEVSSAISALSSVYQPLEASLTALAGGSDFVVFAGPTTSTKTYSLPNANATLLYSGGALGTPASGDASNLTGTASSLTAGSVVVVDSTDSTSFVLIVDSATGNLVAKTDGGITYNSASGGLTLTGPITAGSGSEFKNTWIKSGNSTGIKLGADDGSTNLTDATMKGANVSMPHYSSSTEEDVTLFRLTSSSGNNTLSIGGANANQNALTAINFYTGATNTTTSGTRRGGFNGAGVFDVTATTSSTTTGSGSATFGGGIGVAENINAGGYIKSTGAVTGLTIHSTNGGHYSAATGTGNDGGAGSVTYGGIAPITFYVKDVPVLTTGSPADIATITLPAGITRWTTSLSSSTSGGGVRCSAWDFTATMAAANFTLYSAAAGGGTALTGVFTGPGSDTVYTGAVAASASTIVQSNTIYIRQTANSTNPGSCDFYITIYPIP